MPTNLRTFYSDAGDSGLIFIMLPETIPGVVQVGSGAKWITPGGLAAGSKLYVDGVETDFGNVGSADSVSQPSFENVQEFTASIITNRAEFDGIGEIKINTTTKFTGCRNETFTLGNCLAFHPTGSGSRSNFIGRTTFRLFRLVARFCRTPAPSLVLVIFCWAILVATGFALSYWGVSPRTSGFPPGRNTMMNHGFFSVLYFPMEIMTTLGLGDLAPQASWLRIAVALHALIGFALVTASVSWIVQLYSALARLRTLAKRTSILAEAEQKTGINVVFGEVQSLLGELGLDAIRTRVDLVHFPLLYDYSAGSERASLPAAIPHLPHFAESGIQDSNPRVRLASVVLRSALDEVAEVLG